MKTTKIAAIGAVSVLAVLSLMLVVPAMAATQNSTITLTSSTATGSTIIPSSNALSVGQTISFTSTNGVWHQISFPSAVATTTTSADKSGPASGTMTLTVTGAFKGGYSLSLTSGTITINGISYTFGAGSAQMGPRMAHLVGQGTLAGSTPGSFLFAAGAHANFQGKSYNTLRLDVSENGAEYGVLLLVTAQVS